VASDAKVAATLSAAAAARGVAFDLKVTAKAFLEAFELAVEDL
jgi:hypothetical protein